MKKYTSVKNLSLIVLLLLLNLSACKDEFEIQEETKVQIPDVETSITPYDFNWDDPNLNWMPYPASQPAIPVPWVGQGSLSGVISDDVLADRKESDGWELVYTTFDPNIWNKNPYFMLYNKYRGLLRIYQYVNDLNTFANSTYLQDGLFQSSQTLTMLNFAEQEIVDVSSNAKSVDRVQPTPFNGSPLANNKWYFMQYEMAYDPSITPSTTSNPPKLNFYVNSINISQISLGGDLEGTIRGTIGGTSSSGNFWDAATPGLKSLGTAGLSAVGVQAVDNNTIDENGNNEFGINKSVWKGIKKGLEGALSGATGNIPGAVVNILSGIIGGSSSSAGQTANLTVSAELTVDGTQQDKGSLPSQPVSFYIPGSVERDGNGDYNFSGYEPLYNESLGLFNLANKPTIKINKSRSYTYGGQYAYTTNYSIKSGTLNIQWNPVVNGQDATIENLKTEIVAVIGNNYLNTYGPVSTSGRTESVKGEYTITKNSSLSTSHVYTGSIPASASPKNVYLRVSFVVKPNDGSPESAIIKTFDVTQEVWSNY